MKKIKTTSGALFTASIDDVDALLTQPKIRFDFVWNLADELNSYYFQDLLLAKTVFLGKIDRDSNFKDLPSFGEQVGKICTALFNKKSILIHSGNDRERILIALSALNLCQDA